MKRMPPRDIRAFTRIVEDRDTHLSAGRLRPRQRSADQRSAGNQKLPTSNPAHYQLPDEPA
jgi:hypothetical protein